MRAPKSRSRIAGMGRPGIQATIGAFGVLWTLLGAPASAETSPSATASSVDELGEILGRVGRHARSLEQMAKRGSFLLRGRMEESDGQGRLKGEKEIVLRVTATPQKRITDILSYLEDGADKTQEAREKQKSKETEEGMKTNFVLPFSPQAQGRYRFTLAERDVKNPGRVRISFKPLERATNTYVGAAWIDVASGEILTMALSPTKTPMFVDQIELQVRFENQTSLGRAPSAISFQAHGGLLFIRKHYRGSATLTETRVAY